MDRTMEQEPSHPSLKQINESFEIAFNAYPAYRHILPFFQSVYTLQEASINDTRVKSSFTSTRLLKEGLEKGVPMLDRQHAGIDVRSGFLLLKSLCDEAAKATAGLAKGADVLKKYVKTDAESIKNGFHLLMSGNDREIAQLADRLEIDGEIFVFFLYNSIWPSLAAHSAQFTRQLHINGSWKKGYCPVCGGLPSLSFLNKIGQRHFICEFCRHQWAVKRNLCPNCVPENEIKSVGYFYSDDEAAYRAYTCDNCKTYIKTVDIRELSRPFYPPLESILTMHLDIKAEKQGYRPVSSGIQLP